MKSQSRFTYKVAAIVALGGLLMGFDASVISGVNKFVQIEFDMTDAQLGLSVGSLTFIAAVAMLFSGTISDRFGRRVVLKACAVIFTISAVGSALAPNFILFLGFRMLGGIGVGASLILAPMYIAEIAPPKIRGTMVSFNQLNIVIGISLAFFTNYLILSLGDSDATWVESLGIGEHNWRWMLGLEALPAVLYFFGLYAVPRSPRWLLMKGHNDEALSVMKMFRSAEEAEADAAGVKAALAADEDKPKAKLTELFKPAMGLVLTIGLVVGILQQITGINSVFFYAPMIFEQTGGGTDAAFQQAIIVGLVNLVFTVIAMIYIDRLGRKKLLSVGVAGIAIFMFIIAYGFNQATYELKEENLVNLSADIEVAKLQNIVGNAFENDVVYKEALRSALGNEQAKIYESELITAAIDMNPTLILVGILGFIASFAISLGPVMWVLFSELFPLSIKAIAISFVGFVNSMVSAGVQSVFPWELSTLGSSMTFLIYGVFAVFGLVFILLKVPETKGKSLEELEKILVKQ
ncbi:sugar porter family MFS transporter [Roseivirga sp. E12]|uniref:sugar porter family MFS transporter n=1 Tax=Roseivirga sp. E12 TaxID=2819237 RepID=UPI001ABC40F5|nr:sugar porter family MFS transporter [Roseivirga sp. E12]MBO3697503.1 sugar porter family MFS transporter [Roseivirga sp. E12]